MDFLLVVSGKTTQQKVSSKKGTAPSRKTGAQKLLRGAPATRMGSTSLALKNPLAPRMRRFKKIGFSRLSSVPPIGGLVVVYLPIVSSNQNPNPWFLVSSSCP